MDHQAWSGAGLSPLELKSIRQKTLERLRRGFSEDECLIYFPDAPCSSLEGILPN